MQTHSSILAWRIPWTEEARRLHTVHGLKRVRHDLVTKPPPPPFIWLCYVLVVARGLMP